MNSPTHKANLLHQKYKEIGIAVVDGTLNGIKTTLVVQHFGTPLNGQVQSASTPSEDTQASALPELNSSTVLAGSSEKLISPLTISKVFSSLTFIILMIVLFIDGYLTIKNNTHRLTGSTAGHIGFLFLILLLTLYNQQGSIF